MCVVHISKPALLFLLQLSSCLIKNAISYQTPRVHQNENQTMTEICREFVESRTVSKMASPADIFNDLTLSKDFGSSKRSYVKEFIFQTPNFPSLYPNNVDCIKFIKAPSPSHRVVLQILQPIALEPDSLCTMDFLEVRDGPFGFSPLIGRFCSKWPPPDNAAIETSGQHMWLRFRSDSTLPHAGFKAVYHFSNSTHDSSTDQTLPIRKSRILRRTQHLSLGAHEERQVSHENIIKMLDYLSFEEGQQPLEAVIDIRSPPQTHIMLHIHHFQVPRMAAWSCDNDKLKNYSTTNYCGAERRVSTTRSDAFSLNPTSLIRTKKLTPAIADPVSMIDGQMTYMELYSGNTIAQTTPPCPQVHRFCIWSANEENPIGNDFLIEASRLVIRTVVASATPHISELTKQPEKETENPFFSSIQQEEETSLPPVTVDVTTMMPNFTFTLTVLSQNHGTCSLNTRACDDYYCILESQWCNEMPNCPSWQDEGAACDPDFTQKVVDPVDEEDTVVDLKEQQALEKNLLEQADLEKHAAIIGSVSLTLIIVAAVCMMFAIRRKRKEAINHEIEIKPSVTIEVPVQHLGRNGTAGASGPPPIASSKTSIQGITNYNDGEDDDDEELMETFTTSGDPLLGGQPKKNGTGFISNHIGFPLPGTNNSTPWLHQKALKPAANYQHRSISRDLEAGGSGKAGVEGTIRSKINTRKKENQERQKELWKSEMELVPKTLSSSQRLDLRYLNRIGGSRAKLLRGESTQTTDGGRVGCVKSPSQHPTLPPPPQRNILQKQKNSSIEVADSSGRHHVPNCRLVGRVRSLGENLRLQDSRDFIEYETSTSTSTSSSLSPSPSSSSEYRVMSPPSRIQPDLAEHKYVNTCVMPHTAAGRRNMKQFSQLSKAFRSMPDMNGVAYRPPVACGHKDCRDYYRLQALRTELLQQERKDYLPAPPKRRRTGERQMSGSVSSYGHGKSEAATADYRMEMMKARKEQWLISDEFQGQIQPKRGNLFKEREFELSSSEPYSTEDDRMGQQRQQFSVRGYENTHLPLADAYSVHGLSDAISVELGSSSRSQSELSVSESIENDDDDDDEVHNISIEFYPPPLPPSRGSTSLVGHVDSVASTMSSLTATTNKDISVFRQGTESMGNAINVVTPSSSSSKSRKPTSNCLVYEYEA